MLSLLFFQLLQFQKFSVIIDENQLFVVIFLAIGQLN